MIQADNFKQVSKLSNFTFVDKHKEHFVQKGRYHTSCQSSDLIVNKQNKLLKEAISLRDQQISQLKIIITTYREKLSKNNNLSTLLFLTNDIQKQFSKSQLKCKNTTKTFAKIDDIAQQLQKCKLKNQKLHEVIFQVEQKLKKELLLSKRVQQNFQTQIQMLKQEIQYKKQEYQRAIDNIKITLQHNHQQRMKILQNKHRAQLQMVNGQLTIQKKLNQQKNIEILKLNQRIKKLKISQENNIKFLQNQDKQLRNSIILNQEKHRKSLKERQNFLISQFHVDLQFIHKEQKQQITILCNRIRLLKKDLEDKDSQIKQLWKMRDNYISRQFGGKQNMENTLSNANKGDNKVNNKIKTEMSQLRLQNLQKYIRN